MAAKPLTSSCNLINYHNSVKPAVSGSKTVKQSQNQSRHHTDNMKGGGSSSSKKQTAAGKTSTQGQNNNKNSSSIFITAKQSSSSVAHSKQVMGKAANAGSGIKPFSTEGHEVTELKDSSSKSALSSTSPEKRFSSRQNAQVAAISMSSSLVNTNPPGLSKTTQ